MPNLAMPSPLAVPSPLTVTTSPQPLPPAAVAGRAAAARHAAVAGCDKQWPAASAD